jgi:hypothetical protein
MKKLPFLIGSLMAGAFVFSGGTTPADDLDCFDGSCGAAPASQSVPLVQRKYSGSPTPIMTQM